MSFKACIWAGRFDADLTGLPNPQEAIPEQAFLAILQHYADRDQAGALVAPRRAELSPDGRRRIIGYIDGEYVIYHRAGFVEMIFAGVDPRIDRFLADCHRALGCGLLDSNNWIWVTDEIVARVKSGE